MVLISQTIGGSLGILAAASGRGVWSLVLNRMINSVLQSILLWYFRKWRPLLDFSFIALRKYYSFGYKLLISDLLDKGYQNLYTLVIAKFFLRNRFRTLYKGR